MTDPIETAGRHPSPGRRVPGWVLVITLSLGFTLAHILLPLELSRLSTRRGWKAGRPGPGNALALALVIPGIAATLRLILQHFHASPDTFQKFQPGQKLITPGLYAHSRNPMYLSELTAWSGWALFYGSFPVFCGFLAWLTLMNFVVVPYEERDLEKRFGESYRLYRNQVPRWLGRLRMGWLHL